MTALCCTVGSELTYELDFDELDRPHKGLTVVLNGSIVPKGRRGGMCMRLNNTSGLEGPLLALCDGMRITIPMRCSDRRRRSGVLTYTTANKSLYIAQLGGKFHIGSNASGEMDSFVWKLESRNWFDLQIGFEAGRVYLFINNHPIGDLAFNVGVESATGKLALGTVAIDADTVIKAGQEMLIDGIEVVQTL